MWGRSSLRNEFQSPECESPRGFLHWGAEMRSESANDGVGEVWSAWDEDRSVGRITARGFLLDDTMDRIVWALDRAAERGVADLAAMSAGT